MKWIEKRLAGRVSKKDFLEQLKLAWKGRVQTDDIDRETDMAMERIAGSGYKEVFDKVGITREDIKKVLEEIKDERRPP